MTATLDGTKSDTETADTVPSPRRPDVFLWGPGYELTAHDIVNAIASYLSEFGDNIGPGGVTVFDVIHAEVAYRGSDLEFWKRRKTPDEIAVIRARAEHLAREYFLRFPVLRW